MPVKIIGISTTDGEDLTDAERDNLTLCVLIAESFRKFLEHKNVPARGQVCVLGMALVEALRELPAAEREKALAAHILSLKASLDLIADDGADKPGDDSMPPGTTKH